MGAFNINKNERGVNNMDLTTFYDDLKSRHDEDNTQPTFNTVPVNTPMAVNKWKHHAHQQADKLVDDCRKHLLVDIYCKIIPIDDDYVDGHHRDMCHDVDAMLKAKGMTPTQYFKSCSQTTNKAPLVEFVLWSTDQIGKSFYEKQEEKLKDAQEKDIEIPEEDAPNIDEDEDVNNQLIDVKNDPEYTTFIDKLKEKTVNKIVSDISKIINDKKEEKKMAFEPKDEAEMESATSVSFDYLQKHMMKESVDCSSMTEDMLGYAIRESTLNMIDQVFRQPYSDLKSFSSRIHLNKGTVINESAVNYFIEACKSSEEVNKVVDDAKKDMNEKIDQNLKASDIVNADDENKNKDNKDDKK
jgi:hypothetical protein